MKILGNKTIKAMDKTVFTIQVDEKRIITAYLDQLTLGVKISRLDTRVYKDGILKSVRSYRDAKYTAKYVDGVCDVISDFLREAALNARLEADRIAAEKKAAELLAEQQAAEQAPAEQAAEFKINYYYTFSSKEGLFQGTLFECITVFKNWQTQDKNRYIAVGVDYIKNGKSGAVDILQNSKVNTAITYQPPKHEYVLKICNDYNILGLTELVPLVQKFSAIIER